MITMMITTPMIMTNIHTRCCKWITFLFRSWPFIFFICRIRWVVDTCVNSDRSSRKTTTRSTSLSTTTRGIYNSDVTEATDLLHKVQRTNEIKTLENDSSWYIINTEVQEHIMYPDTGFHIMKIRPIQSLRSWTYDVTLATHDEGHGAECGKLNAVNATVRGRNDVHQRDGHRCKGKLVCDSQEERRFAWNVGCGVRRRRKWLQKYSS